MKRHPFTVEWIAETGSTNSKVVELAREKKTNAFVLVADHQTQGRGQFGREWHSKPGENLLFSIYLEPAISPAVASELTQITCRAIVAVLESYGVNCSIKLPNDILVNGKKICGILTESQTKGQSLEHVVVGVGLNVNAGKDTLIPEATSMKLVTEKAYDRTQVLDKILAAFDTAASEWIKHVKV